MAESGLTMPQIVTLHILRSAGPFTVSAIAERLKLSKAATSHLIEQLVVKGFVTRIEDSVDRRRKSVSITPKGNRIVERLMQLRRNTFQVALNHLTPELVQELDKVISRVFEYLNAAHPNITQTE
jgi:DNA-binding MarR family transcriptional regulator